MLIIILRIHLFVFQKSIFVKRYCVSLLRAVCDIRLSTYLWNYSSRLKFFCECSWLLIYIIFLQWCPCLRNLQTLFLNSYITFKHRRKKQNNWKQEFCFLLATSQWVLHMNFSMDAVWPQQPCYMSKPTSINVFWGNSFTKGQPVSIDCSDQHKITKWSLCIRLEMMFSCCSALLMCFLSPEIWHAVVRVEKWSGKPIVL